jgi:hypothetical protein
MSVLIKKDQKLITIEEKIRTGISDKEDYEKWLLNPISPTLEEMIYKKELLFMEDRKKNNYDSEDDESV